MYTTTGTPLSFDGVDGPDWALEQYDTDKASRRFLDRYGENLSAEKMWTLLRDHVDSPWELGTETRWGVIASRK